MDMKGESKIGLGLGLVSDPLYCMMDVSEASDSQLDVLLPKPRLTKKGKDKQSQRPTSVPSFLPPVVLDNSKVFFPPPLPSFLYSTVLLISFSLDDRLLHFLSHRRPFPKHQWRLVAKWFKSLPT